MLVGVVFGLLLAAACVARSSSVSTGLFSCGVVWVWFSFLTRSELWLRHNKLGHFSCH